MLLPQSLLVDALRSLGYRFAKKETRKSKLFRMTGGTGRVYVPKTKYVEMTDFVSTLSQAGATRDQIDAFIELCRQEEL